MLLLFKTASVSIFLKYFRLDTLHKVLKGIFPIVHRISSATLVYDFFIAHTRMYGILSVPHGYAYGLSFLVCQL